MTSTTPESPQSRVDPLAGEGSVAPDRLTDQPMDAMARWAAALGLAFDDTLERVAYYSSLRVDAQGRQQSHVTRVHARAVAPGVEHIVVAGRSQRAEAPCRLRVLDGGRLTRVEHDAASRLTIGVLTLPRALQVGESLVYSFETIESHGLPDTVFDVGVRGPLRLLHLDVNFTPPALPSAGSSFARPRGGPATGEAVPLAGERMSVLLHEPGPGTYGITWAW